MANAEAELGSPDRNGAAKAPKKTKAALAIGLAAAIMLGGGSFYAVYSGLILGGGEDPAGHAEDLPHLEALPDIEFVPLDAMTISLPREAKADHLRFRAQLEVERANLADVEHMAPRVVDVLNSYLRAVDPAELADPGALVRLRAQMLRRVQMVVGEGRVRDLLIMEFVLK